jgi:hypothetical protein
MSLHSPWRMFLSHCRAARKEEQARHLVALADRLTILMICAGHLSSASGASYHHALV